MGRATDSQKHGNIFSRKSGSMFIHVQRENGLAHRTLVLRPWQVQLLRMVTSRTFLVVLVIGLVSWGYFAVQAARVPLLNRRIAHLEEDAQRLDTLQRTLAELQARYGQVQQLLTASKAGDAKAGDAKGADGKRATDIPNGPRRDTTKTTTKTIGTTTKKNPGED